MRFSEIPGHKDLKKELISLIENQRLPHSLLFTGPSGNGKLALAVALASYIQCNGEKGLDKCGNCSACKKTDKIIHSDIQFVFPTISAGKKSMPSTVFLSQWRELVLDNPFFNIHDWMKFIDAENKQANIAKVSVIELLNNFNYKLFEGNKKISIIWNAELLAKEGNRLLKLLEEPPQDSLIILVADDTSKVLPTILSRCQIVRVPPFSDEDLKDWTHSKTSFNSDNISQLVRIAEGDISLFRKLLSQGNEDFFDNLLKWFRICYQGKSEDMVAFAADFAKNSKDYQKFFFRYALKFLEHILQSFYLPREEIKLVDVEYDSMLKIKNILTEEKAITIVEDFNDNVRFLERNANPKLLVFTSSLKLHKVLRY